MNRREFITLLGAAAAAWPLAARAQQGERVRRIGSFSRSRGRSAISEPLWRVSAGVAAIGLGYRPQRAGRRPLGRQLGPRPAQHAAELVALAPDVILANGGSAVLPLMQATRTVPIVFPIATDPVGAGFVASLARPAATSLVS